MSKTSELKSTLLGVTGLNSYVRSVSAARLAMFCSHIGQALVVEGATVNRTVTGVERQYAKDDRDIRFPCNAIVLKVVKKFTPGVAMEVVKENTITSIIYENVDSPTREIGILHLPRYQCLHQHFGFNYVLTSEASRLYPNEAFSKDTVIATSPIVTPEGDYKYGIEAQVAMMSVPSIIEDGMVFSESFAKRLRTKAYGVRTVSWGRNAIPVNLYGDPNKPDEYKPFPDIGEYVNENGLLFATRSFDELLAVPMLSVKALRESDFFDKPVQAVPGAKIIDVVVYKGNKNKTFLPAGMDQQCRYYYTKTCNYYKHILDEYYKLKREQGETLTISPAFSNLVVKAEAYIKLNEKTHLKPCYQRAPVDEWLVDVVYEYDIEPTTGFKATGMNGDKGVCCAVWPDADMPVDASGNVADVITDFDSSIKRMNPSRTYEQYINASARATSLHIAHQLSTQPNTPAVTDSLWEYLYGFYSLVTPLILPLLDSKYNNSFMRRKHLEDVARDGIYKWQPTDNPVDYIEVISELSKHYPAPYGPVRYRGRSGRMVITKTNVLIGGLYMLLLEKIGNTWQSVSSAKLQHFGIPAKLSKADKYASPGRHNPVRILGESEARLIAAICGGDIVADLLDQANNPVVHRTITYNLLTANTPTRIDKIVDRNLMPIGNGRILTLVRHVSECAGFKFTRGV